jgi:hypothetical protein
MSEFDEAIWNALLCRQSGNIDRATRTLECRSNRIIHRDAKRVSADTCMECPYHNKPNRWPLLGELVAGVLLRLGIRRRKTCGCAQRESRLNLWGLRMVFWAKRAPAKMLRRRNR